MEAGGYVVRKTRISLKKKNGERPHGKRPKETKVILDVLDYKTLG